MLPSARALRALAVAGLCSLAVAVGAAPRQAPQFGDEAASVDARHAAEWVLGAGDHYGLPFAIVDKKGAKLYVFDRDGRLAGASAALVGATRGDYGVPGVGQRPQHLLKPGELTTPAGRFVAEPGRNLDGEHVVWFDYGEGLAIHRVRAGASHAARARSLATATPDDNRRSLGCVVVPVAFYESVVQRVLGRQRSVVYVLPETMPVQALFGGGLHLAQRAD